MKKPGWLEIIIIEFVSLYLRSSSIEAGRWRLIDRYLPRLRIMGGKMGARTITTHHKFKMRVNLSEWIGQHIYMTGGFEKEVAETLRKILEPGDVFVDVGANIGFFSLLASKVVGPGGRIYAFEPAPGTHQIFENNIKINGLNNIDVHQIALSRSNGQVPFYMKGQKKIKDYRAFGSWRMHRAVTMLKLMHLIS